MMTLYYTDASCSAAAHITIEETGQPYTARFLDFSKSEQRAPAYLKINPKGKVPALDVDGTVVTENVAIQYYLATAFPDARLCPTDREGFVRWLSLVSWISNTVHPDARHITRPENYSDEPSNFDAIREKGRKTLRRWLGDIDAMLGQGPWMMGDDYSTADPYALVFVGVALSRGVSVTDLVNIRRWRRDMIARPAVRKILQGEKSPLLDSV